MKVETPQLRWHQIINPQSQKDVGANGPILSCSLLSIDSRTGVLATAGNAEVNLWRVRFTENQARSASSSSVVMHGVNAREDYKTQHHTSHHILVQPQQLLMNNNTITNTNPAADQQSTIPTEHTHIEHIVTLSRGTNERSINAVKFSPSGKHLVAAGDGGVVVVYSMIHSTTNNATNPMIYWSTVEKETDLNIKIIFNQSDDVMDVAWSADSKRFILGSLDHTLTVWEAYSHASSGVGGATAITAGEWRNVHRSAKDHTHYIQGVAYDPKGVYLASMGSDRMVKVYSRKGVKENLLNEGLAKYTLDETTFSTKQSNDAIEKHHQRKEDENKSAILQTKVIPEILTSSSFSLQNKVKTLKFLNDKPVETIRVSPLDPSNAKDSSSPSKSVTNPSVKRHHMFADELTLGSFFRRLSFTTDGAFLVVPAALWHGRKDLASSSATSSPVSSSKNDNAPLLGSPTSVVSNGIDKLSESSFATYLFARHHFDQPYKVLTGLGKPSVVVRPNPVLFQIPRNNSTKSVLPYRSLFAVLTNDSVIIYDTFHNQPLALARGLHYAGLTDAAWSSDGRTLFVTSSDGYISILSFMEGELGDVYETPTVNIVETSVSISETDESSVSQIDKQSDPSPAVAPEVRIQPETNVVANTLIARKKPAAAINADIISEKKKVTFGDPLDDRSVDKKRSSDDALESVIEPQAVSINVLVAKKKKKVNPIVTM